MYYIATLPSYKGQSLVCDCGKRHRTLRGAGKCVTPGAVVRSVSRGTDAAGYHSMMQGMLTLQEIEELNTTHVSAAREAYLEYYAMLKSLRVTTY